MNRGIVEAFEAGTLSSASLMVNTPAFGAAAALARERAPALGVGLHFNLVSGRPLSPVSTLANPRTGEFFLLPELALRAFSGRIGADDVRRECDAQISLLQAEGIAATHLDSHRHTHALPGILAPVLASARAAGVPIVRRPLDHVLLTDPVSSSKMAMLHASWRLALRGVAAADREQLRRSPNFRGIALQDRQDVGSRLLAMLDHLPPTPTEIMLHPGYSDEVLAAQDAYREARDHELAALLSPVVRERLTRGDVRLVNFRGV